MRAELSGTLAGGGSRYGRGRRWGRDYTVKSPFAAWSQWVASCREQMEALTARAPPEPADFRREAKATCKCAELNRFLSTPSKAEHRFRARQERRTHLEHQIREHLATVQAIEAGPPK